MTEQTTKKDEYEIYMRAFNEEKKSIIGDNPHAISKSLVNINGINLRVGQIIADLLLEFNDEFITAKNEEETDKMAKAVAENKINNKHGISLKHFENLDKSLTELIRSLKKRLKFFESEYTNV